MTEDEPDGISEVDDETVLGLLRYKPGETVAETMDLPSALWAAAVREKPDDTSVDEWLRRLLSAELAERDREHERKVQVDVEVDAEFWERVCLHALYHVQTSSEDKSPEEAYRDTVSEHLQVFPTLVVDGEPKGPEDLAEWIDGEVAGCEEGGDHA